MNTEASLNAIKTTLVSGIQKDHRRRSRRKTLAAVPVLGLLAAGGIATLAGTADPAYALTKLGEGSIRVEVYPNFDDVDGLRDDLADAGVEAEVINLRAHPELVGVVEVVGHDNEAAGALEFDGGEFVIEIDKLVGPVEILIYSRAGGDDYQASPSVFSPEQPLAGFHCTFIDGPMSTSDFEKVATDAGIFNFEWTVFGDIDEETGVIDSETRSSRPEGNVSGAQFRNADLLDVFISDTDEPAADWIAMTDGTHDRNPPSCTAELAARWN